MKLDYNRHFTLDKIPSFLNAVLDKISHAVPENILFDLKLSIEEALINAVKHGNKLNEAKKISLQINLKSDKIEVYIKDEGKGFDYENIPSPVTKANIKKASGRGVFLMRRFMDKVEFLDRGSMVKMIKYFDNSRNPQKRSC